MSRGITIADALVTYLGAQSFTPSVTITRRLFPIYQEEKQDSNTLDVVVGAEQRELVARGTWQKAVGLSVVLRCPTTGDTDAVLLPLENLAEAIGDSITSQSNYANYPLTIFNRPSVLVPEILVQHGVFQTVFDLGFFLG